MIRRIDGVKIAILTIFLNLTHLSVFGQSLRYDFPFSVSQYDAKKNLPQNQVLDVAEWRDEIVVSTMNGVVSWDGDGFLPLITDKAYMENIYYRLYAQRSSGELFGWSTSGNYSRIFPYYKQLADYSCVSSENDTLTGIQKDGLVIVSGYDTHVIYDKLQTDIKNAVAIVSSKDYFYISDEKHLYSIRKKTGEKQILIEGYFSVLKRNPYNDDICAVNGDLFFIRPEKKTINLVNTSKTREIFRDLEFISINELLITSSRGMYHVVNGISSFYNVETGLTSNSLYGIQLLKSDNCILIGSENNGLIKLMPKTTRTFFTDSKVNHSQSFSSVVKDSSGSVYSTASRGDVIKIDKKGNKSTFLSIDKYIATLSWINDKMYVGTFGEGMIIYNKHGEFIESVKLPLPASTHVLLIHEDREYNIWVGFQGGIVRRKKGGEYERILATQGNIISVYELKNGDLCFGGTGEFFILSKEGRLIHRIGEKEGLRGREVRCFYEDDSGRLWIGTYGGGLFVYNQNKLVSINSKSGCELNKDIFTLIKGDNDQLFMSSNQGIWSVKEKKLQEFYKGIIPWLIPEYYGEETGIINTEFNGGFHHNYLKEGNKIYFPSIYGLVEFNTRKKMSERKVAPKIKSVIVNDTIIPLSSSFDRKTHTIQFDFYCPTFSEQRNIYYQYRLTGGNSSDNWNPLQKSKQVILKMLPPGEYIFSVRAIDCYNDPNPKILSYHFSIAPYFYETKWFVLLLSSAIVMIAYFFVRFQIRRIQSRNKVNNTLLELKLKAIQSKMNPHFMFNSLNNIIYLLTTGKHKEAERLLEDFSLLLRRFLEKSDDFFISLSEELEIIELYLSIQQKRYNYLFDYKVEYPREAGEILIPSMLIQPFVENAVIHGIAHSKRHCHLEISVRNVEGILEIRIQDDGIGREKSAEINKNRNRHNSHGIRLINEKIRVMRRKYGQNISFQILDIEKEDLSGTIILINIPVYDNGLRNY